MSSCASRSRSPSAGLRPGASALAEKRCVPNSGQTQQGRPRVWRRGTLNPISAMQVAWAMQMVSETHNEMSGNEKSSPRRRRVEAEWPYNTFKRISSFAALILLYANEVLFKIGVAGEEHEALHKYFMSDVERTTLFDNFKSKQRCTLSYKTDRSTLHVLAGVLKKKEQMISAQTLFELVCYQTVFPNVKTQQRIGPLLLKDFLDIEYSSEFVDKHFKEKEVIPARLKMGMLEALYPKKMGIKTEHEGVSRFLSRTAHCVNRNIATLQEWQNLKEELDNVVLQAFVTEKLALPRFRGIMVCRLIGLIDSNLYRWKFFIHLFSSCS